MKTPTKSDTLAPQVRNLGYLAGRAATFDTRSISLSTSFLALDRLASRESWFTRPKLRIGWDFCNVALFQVIQSVKEFAISTIQFVECPGVYSNPLVQRVADQVEGDLLLGLKLDVVGYVVFFRRTGSFAQSSGKYKRLSRIVLNVGVE